MGKTVKQAVKKASVPKAAVKKTAPVVKKSPAVKKSPEVEKAPAVKQSPAAKKPAVAVKASASLGAAARKRIGEEEYFDRIKDKAYEIFIARACTHGSDLDDWYEAERQVQVFFTLM